MTARAVFAHGFTQTGHSWDEIRDRLAITAPSLETVAVDLPGHGSATDVVADLWGAADQLVALGGRGSVVGYSMGGRVALHAALAHPDAVERLVLIGATAGIDDDDERHARRAADEALAARIEAIGVERFLDEWLANPLFAGLDERSAQRADRMRNTVGGLASSLRHCGTGTQEPLWARLGTVRCPTLIVVGEADEKFRGIAERLRAVIPHSEVAVIAHSGHSCHLEQPAATAHVLNEFLT